MKFKHQRQHNKRPDPEFFEAKDRFGNLTLTATVGGKSVSKSHVPELRISQVKKELTRLITLQSESKVFS